MTPPYGSQPAERNTGEELKLQKFEVGVCSVTGLAASESYKVLMLLQISLFSWVNRYLHCWSTYDWFLQMSLS